MTLRTRMITAAKLRLIEKDVPVQLWNSGLAAALYGNVVILTCTESSGALAGLWVCPVDGVGAARRPLRLLPYASPWIDRKLHPAVRHRVAWALLSALRSEVSLVDLPMSPEFRETAGFLAAGASAAFRHTRALHIGPPPRAWREGYLPATRNHVRAARGAVTVARTSEGEFDFRQAIKGQDATAVEARQAAGLSLGASDWPTFCLSAIDGNGTCRGQVLAVRSLDAAILLHSWFDRDGPRGVPSLLADEAISLARTEWAASVFDFEGSVIATTDQFMAGFGAEAIGYAQVRAGAVRDAGTAGAAFR
jgi:hypothetical protein